MSPSEQGAFADASWVYPSPFFPPKILILKESVRKIFRTKDLYVKSWKQRLFTRCSTVPTTPGSQVEPRPVNRFLTQSRDAVRPHGPPNAK
jgi:hypothetical protein